MSRPPRALQAVARPDVVPLSPAQQRMWVRNQSDPQSSADQVAFALRLTGQLDVTGLQQAVIDVVQRHETLRTYYPAADGVGQQLIMPMEQAPIPDLTPQEITEADVSEWLAAHTDGGFDVSAQVPLRMGLAQAGSEDYLLVVVVHHIAADGASVAPFLRDLVAAFLARRNRSAPAWSPLPVQYADYTLWQRALLGAEDDPTSLAARQVAYWRDRLAGLPQQVELPTDRPRPAVPAGRGASHAFTLDAALCQQLAQGYDASLFMVVHAVLAVLLARLSGTEDIVIGTTVAGRDEPQLDDLVGMFGNPLVLRTPVVAAGSFRQLLGVVKDADLGAFANAELPFQRLVEALDPVPSPAHQPLFQVALCFQDVEAVAQRQLPLVRLPGLSVSALDLADVSTRCDLQLTVLPPVEGDGVQEFSALFSYDTALFEAATVATLADRFTQLLAAAAADPDRPVGDLDLMGPDERTRILSDWNATDQPVPPVPLLAGFWRTVQLYPNAVAVSCQGAHLTYAQLGVRADQLARQLIARGVGPESLVGLALRRSLDLVVGMYGVLTAGGAVVPLDPDLPEERIADLLTAAQPVCVVTTGLIAVPDSIQVLQLDTGELERTDARPLRPAEVLAPVHPQHPAYVIFTAGSTGRPEGVVVSQAAIHNQISWMLAAYPLGTGDVYLQKTATTCDVSLWGYLMSLRSGAKLVLASPDGHRDPVYLSELIAAHKVTVTDFAPSLLADFAAHCKADAIESLLDVFTIGEALPGQTVAALQRVSQARVHNLYGHTEAAVSVTYWRAEAGPQTVPIGLPQWNTRLYVLDSRLRPTAVGVPGELYLAGDQLARGYLRRPALTADRFVANPFGTGERMYRTSDLVVWRTPDGEASARLEFVRRSPAAPPSAPVPPSRPAPASGPARTQAITNAAADSPTAEGTDAGRQAGRHDGGSAAGASTQGPGAPPRLPLVSRPDPVPLSLAQLRMWFLNRFRQAEGAETAGLAAYNVPLALRLTGTLKVAALAAAVGDVVARHEVLRTVYPQTPNGPVQRVLPATSSAAQPAVPAVQTESVAAEQVPTVVAQLARVAFDVTTEVPVRVRLLTVTDLPEGSQPQHVLVVVAHHIAADGASLAPLVRDVMAAYAARAADAAPDWQPLPMQYADYAVRQRAMLGDETDPRSIAAVQLKFWRHELAGLPDVVPLPTDRPRPAVASLAGARVPVRLKPALHAALAQLARAHQGTLFTVLHTALAVLVARMSGSDDIAIGSPPLSGRAQPQLDDLIGMFVNTVVLRTRVARGESFADLLDRQRETELGAFAHADVPFERLVEVLNPTRSTAVHPLFQVGLRVHTEDGGVGRQLAGLSVVDIEVDVGVSQFDLDVVLADRYDSDGAAGGVSGFVTYATELFDETTVTTWVARWVALLAVVAATPTVPVGDVALLTEDERDEVLFTRNETRYPTHGGATLASVLHRCVVTAPDAVAVVADSPGVGRREFSYAELDRRVNRLARHLMSLGIGPESRVALAFRRSVDLLTALYAVTKAGGAYVPIDPEQPAERIGQILDTTEPVCLLTDAATAFGTDDEGGLQVAPRRGDTVPHNRSRSRRRVLVVDELDLSGYSSRPIADAERRGVLRASNTAYVVFPSGSTGQPTGVAVSHAAVLNQLVWLAAEFGLVDDDVVLLKTPATFDLSVWEIWSAVACGGRVVVAAPDGHRDARYLTELVRSEGVTTLFLVPSLLAALLTADTAVPGVEGARRGRRHGGPGALRRVLAIGETLPVATAQRFMHAARADPATGLFAGVPLFRAYGPAETTVSVTCHWVSEADAGSVPIGTPEWNTRVYVLDARLHPVPDGVSGELYVAGAQVARGYFGRPGRTAQRFVPDAFGVGERMYRTGDLVRWTSAGQLEYLGRNDSPVEVGGLRSGEVQAAQPAQVRLRAPQTRVEQVVATIYSQLLGVPAVGLDDDFFALGGNSLLATQLAARVGAALPTAGDGTSLPVRVVFAAPTVAGLAAVVDRGGERPPRAPLTAGQRPERIPLTFGQQRIWFINQFDTSAAVYNIAVAVRMSGALQLSVLQRAIADVVTRHETLRTSYPNNAGADDDSGATGPVQKILPPDEVPVAATPVPVTADELDAQLTGFVTTGFDVTMAVPWRLGLFQLASDEFVLAFLVHHIAADGSSLGPLTRDLMTAYASRVAGAAPAWAPLPVQYADFAVWQRAVLGDESDETSAIAAQLAYWTGELAGLPHALNLPTDRPRPLVQSFAGARVPVSVDASMHAALLDLGRRSNATLFMVLHAALVVLLARVSASDDIAIGTPVAGRGERELDDLVGMFVNTLVLRSHVDLGAPFTTVLAEARDTTLRAFANSDIPFARLVQVLHPQRSTAHHPLFQVSLSLADPPLGEFELPGLRVAPVDIAVPTAQFDLSLTVRELPASGGIVGDLCYATDLFDEVTAAGLVRRLVRLLSGIVAAPQAPIGDLPLLSNDELGFFTTISGPPAGDHAVVRTGMLLPQLLTGGLRLGATRVAVRYGDRSVTYGELDEQSSRLARVLVDEGVGPEQVVAVALPRSYEFVLAVAAVAKAGGAYLPVDPSCSEDRMRYLVQDSAAVLGITIAACRDSLPARLRWLVLDDAGLVRRCTQYAAGPVTDADRLAPLRISHPAYMIYTSGSTGPRMGVVITHAGLAPVAATLLECMQVSPEDRVLHICSPSFAASVMEWVCALWVGATLVIARAQVVAGAELAQVLREQQVTRAIVTPAVLATVEPVGPDLAVVGVGGAVTTPQLLARWQPGRTYYNLYGSTEATIFATYARLSAGDRITIGGPVAAATTVVLDRRLRPVAPGVAAELYLAGPGLARGYRGQPGWTAQHFVANPWGPAGTRMYRTGDVVRWCAQRYGEAQAWELEYVAPEPAEVDAVAAAPAYEPPRSAAERLVAQAIGQVVGRERVGRDDDFFALGGDSLMAIAVVSRAGAAGVRFTVRDVFTAHTVAGLARIATAAAAAEVPRSGAVPLPPLALRRATFGELLAGTNARGGHPGGRDISAAALELPTGCGVEQVGAAVQRLVRAHPMLYAALHVAAQQQPRLVIAATAADVGVREFATADAAVPELAGEIDPAAGRNIAVGLVAPEAAVAGPTLVLVANALVVDDVSWRIIIDELSRSWADEQPVSAPEAATPDRSILVTRAMAAQARAAATTARLPWWQSALAGLPAEPPVTSAELAARGRVSLVITNEGAAAVSAVAAIYHGQIMDVLLAALGLAVQLAGPLATVVGPVVRVYTDARAVAGDESGVTVGGFTVGYPLPLRLAGVDLADALAGGAAAGAVVKQVKQARREVPDQGVSYALLSCATAEPGALLAGLAHGRMALRYRDLRPARMYPDAVELDLVLDIVVEAVGDELVARFDYAANIFAVESVKEFAGNWVRALGALAEHGMRSAAGGFTPSDFPLLSLSQPDIDRLYHDYPDMTAAWPVTPLQAGMLFHAMLAEQSMDMYTVQFTADFSGELDAARWQAAAQAVLDRHDSLRVAFVTDAVGTPLQVVSAGVELPWRTVDLAQMPAEEVAAELVRAQEVDYRAHFAMGTAPLLRFTLIRCRPGQFRVVVTSHRVLVDGWSLPLVLLETMTLYAQPHPQLPPAHSYGEYLAWLAAQDRDAAVAAWRRALAGFTAPTPLASVDPGREIAAGFGVAGFELSAEDTAALTELASELAVTVNTVVQAAWGLLVGRCTDCDDVVFGATVSARPAQVPGVETMVGSFLSTIPVRVRLRPNETLAQLLQRLQAEQDALRDYHYVGLPQIEQATGVASGFDSVLVLESFPMDRVGSIRAGVVAGLEVTWVGEVNGTHYPLTVQIVPGEALRVSVKYLHEVFSAAAAGALVRRFAMLISRFVASPQARVATVDAVLDSERETLAATTQGRADITGGQPAVGKATVAPDAAATLLELFDAQVARSPQAPALYDGDTTVTYAELDLRSRVLAALLAQWGVGPEKLVAVAMRPSIELVVATYAILRAGGGYVPVDPDQPGERSDAVLASAAPVCILTTTADDFQSAVAAQVVATDTLWLPESGALQPFPKVESDAVAVVMFADSAMGSPPGVVLTHRQAVNQFHWAQRRYPHRVGDVVLLQTPITVATSLWELLWPLHTGAAVMIAEPDRHRDLAYLSALMVRRSVTTVHFVPDMLETFLDPVANPAVVAGYPSLRWIFAGGEALSGQLASACGGLLPNAQLVNWYGAAEAMVVTAYPVVGVVSDPVPIGRPVTNTPVRVLNRQLLPVPPGSPGELYVGGVQVARGYHDAAGQTAQRFVAGAGGQRWYRTGDLVVWRDDVLMYLGRVVQWRRRQQRADYRAPATPLEHTVAGVFAEVLGVDQVGLDDDFFALGGNSLVAARAVGRLQVLTGALVRVQWFLAGASVAAVTQQVLAALAQEHDDDQDRDTALDVVLPIRATGAAPPLFAIHPRYGLAWCYAPVTAFVTDRPIVGLQSPALLDEGYLPGSVHELAARHVAEIRRLQPHGPYHLMGWSFGGVLAHAAATALQAAGEEVAALVMLDSHPTVDVSDFRAAVRSALAEVGVGAETLVGPPGVHAKADDLRDPSEAALRALLASIPGELAVLTPRRLRRIYRSAVSATQLSAQHTPGVFRGRMDYFSAAGDEEAAGTWRDFVIGVIFDHPIDATGEQMILPPAMADVGPQLAAVLAGEDAEEASDDLGEEDDTDTAGGADRTAAGQRVDGKISANVNDPAEDNDLDTVGRA